MIKLFFGFAALGLVVGGVGCKRSSDAPIPQIMDHREVTNSEPGVSMRGSTSSGTTSGAETTAEPAPGIDTRGSAQRNLPNTVPGANPAQSGTPGAASE